MFKGELNLDQHGQLSVINNGKRTAVTAKSCFPWSHPTSYISLRDNDDKEVLLVKSLDELSENSRHALLRTLQESGFCFIVTKLYSVKEDFELRVWEVETLQGRRTFETKLLDWPRELSAGQILVQDIYGDIYCIEDVEKLPEPGRSILWAYID